MSRILVTGCSGFIGSQIAISAKQVGIEVLATTKSFSGNLQHELGMPIMVLDLLKPFTIREEKNSIDAIIHCATANDILSLNFEAGISLSVTGTRNVLEFAVLNGIKRIIFFSTLQVYGTELNGKILEDSPVFCQKAYALNHFFGEELCRMYARAYNLNIVLLRPSNVFGFPAVKTVRRDTLVPICFVNEIIQNGVLTLRSSGLQQRNFISTNEVADACLYLLNNFPQGCHVINLGSEWLCSIREVAEMTIQVYFEKFGKSLQLNILSDDPKIGNHFTIHSSIAFLRLSAMQSKQVMKDVINTLFENRL